MGARLEIPKLLGHIVVSYYSHARVYANYGD